MIDINALVKAAQMLVDWDDQTEEYDLAALDVLPGLVEDLQTALGSTPLVDMGGQKDE